MGDLEKLAEEGVRYIIRAKPFPSGFYEEWSGKRNNSTRHSWEDMLLESTSRITGYLGENELAYDCLVYAQAVSAVLPEEHLKYLQEHKDEFGICSICADASFKVTC